MTLRLLPAALAAACLLACGCQRERPVEAQTAAEPVRGQPALFRVPPEQAANLHIVSAGRTSWSIVVRTTGTVDWNGNLTTPAITQVNGPIVRITANPGDTVSEGQPLLYVNSPDVSNAIAVYRKARSRQDLAKRVLARNTDLLEHKALARKDYESALADFNDAGTDALNSLESLRIFGINSSDMEAAEKQGAEISPELAVRAPITGTVVQKLVSPGQLVQAGATACFLISDISTVWVQGHIFDRDLPAVRTGDPVELTNPSLPSVYRGVVEYVGAMVDPATRTTPVRIATRNTAGLLKKDMFVDAVIHTRTRRNVLVVPVSAVLHNAENQPFIYVQARPGEYAERLVTVGGAQGGQIEIARGIKQGEQVVAEGAIFLQFANSSR